MHNRKEVNSKLHHTTFDRAYMCITKTSPTLTQFSKCGKTRPALLKPGVPAELEAKACAIMLMLRSLSHTCDQCSNWIIASLKQKTLLRTKVQ